MSKLSPLVAELLEPIPGGPPTGVDLDPNVKEYTELEQELTKATPNYLQCVTWATTLLKSKSKHLRVAALLGFAWYRTEKFTGLQNAMLLLAELVARYSDHLFPAKPLMRSKAIQLLSTEKVTKLLEREACSAEEAQAALAAYQRLVSVCDKHFPQNGPVLTALGQVLEKHVSTPGSGSAVRDQLPVTSDQSPLGSDQQPATNDQQSTTSNQQPATGLDLPLIDATGASEQPAPKLEIPELVAELLKPISASAPTGRDVTQKNDEDYQDYLTLQAESNKIRPNYDMIIELAVDLLKSKCKDLEAMVWLAFAWFGKHRIAGLKNGSLLMLNALEQFGDKLFPEDGLKRSRSAGFLNRKEIAKILAKEKLTKENAKDVLALQAAWNLLKEEYHKQLGAYFKTGQVSPFKAIGEVIDAQAKEVEELLRPAAQVPTMRPATSTPASTAATTSARPSGTGASVPTGGGVAITSNDSARQGMRKAVLFFFEEEKDGKKTRKAADDVSIYAFSRELRWSKLTLPDYKDKDEGKITAIEGPTPEKQTAVKNWISNSEWEALIPDIEIRFLNDEGFVYWLDGQRYVVQALEAKGGKWNQAGQEIKFHLARLVQRLPELPKLMFKDKKTPFAEKATVKWLEEEVKGMLGSGKGEEKILPPIMGEEYEAINKEYEVACTELPENFEKNAAAMQQAIAGDVRRKGRFLRGLNLANYCLAAGKPELAKALLADLMKKITAYQLAEWEPALCTAVWQSAYLANLKLLRSDDHVAVKAELQAQQSMLFAEIGKHDCLRALELSNRQPKEE
ncbi:type VI secretion system domain-containing protein [candidate division KSB1 bacterium]|nr:type VI secretion system domain-containing protein [candidate division KSB1 bacterium]